MGVGRISPISGYSSISYIQPMRYSVENTSQPSDAYVRSVRRTGGRDAVTAATPVRYANATEVTAAKQEAAKKTENAFNKVASSFDSGITGYGRDGGGQAYDVIGSQLNLFA